ncbi:MAG: PP2C family protein-serine/threonine phosphatase [Planctomycetota bacterium]|jgi:sigma-B regulation protein RsbU (phosphoserine phosphatase)
MMDSVAGKLLVVDDNEMNRDMLSRRLSRRGHTVLVAENGAKALEIIEKEPFDLILLDIMMPVMDGMQVLETVRRTRSASDLPIIMATAKSESEDVVKALKMGANDYVTKPLDFAVVLARLNTQLALKRASDALSAAHARMKRDLEAAARVQQTLLPSSLPESDHANFGWAYRPCDELAGDALNIFEIDGRFVGVYVLDVSGHGVPAALLSVTATRSLTPHGGASQLKEGLFDKPEDISPAAIAARLNRLYPMEENGGHYFTLLFGVLDTQTGRFLFSSAGQPGPILLRSDGAAEYLDAPGFPVGMTDDVDYEDTVVELRSGDRLYLYSDGVDEEANPEGEVFGRDRLIATIAEGRATDLQESIDLIVRKVIDWHGDDHLKDDVSIAAVEMT